MEERCAPIERSTGTLFDLNYYCCRQQGSDSIGWSGGFDVGPSAQVDGWLVQVSREHDGWNSASS